MSKGDADDPKGLIFEAFRIEGISAEQCRVIFLDWALSLPDANESGPALERLVRKYAPDHENHPMLHVIREGMGETATPRRRGGWRARRPA